MIKAYMGWNGGEFNVYKVSYHKLRLLLEFNLPNIYMHVLSDGMKNHLKSSIKDDLKGGLWGCMKISIQMRSRKSHNKKVVRCTNVCLCVSTSIRDDLSCWEDSVYAHDMWGRIKDILSRDEKFLECEGEQKKCVQRWSFYANSHFNTFFSCLHTHSDRAVCTKNCYDVWYVYDENSTTHILCTNSHTLFIYTNIIREEEMGWKALWKMFTIYSSQATDIQQKTS